jgi:hypothetical protein
MAQDQKQLADELYKLIYGASSRSLPAGVFGTQRTLAPDLLQTTGSLCGAIKHTQASSEQINDFRGLCALAQATGTLAESDLAKIDGLLDKVKVR